MHTGDKVAKASWSGGLNIALEATWLLLIFLLPVYFNPFGYEVFYLAKALLLQSGVCLLLGLYLAGWFLADHGGTPFNLLAALRRSPLQVVVLVFGVLWVISTIFSITPEASLWGSLARKNGLISIIASIVFFLIVAKKIRKRSQLYRALYALVFSSAIVCIIGITQFIDPRLLAWFSFNGRVSSTDGNPLSLSAFISMVIPVNLALAMVTWYRQPIDSKRNIKLFGFLAVFVVQIACLGLAQYSVTLLLFIPGMFLFLLLAGIFLRRKAVVLSASAALLSLLLIAVVLLGQLEINRAVVPPGKTQRGFAVADSIGIDTIDMRFSMWKCAVDIIRDSPEVPFYQDNYHAMRRLIGYGPETFVIVSQTRYPASLRSMDAYNSILLGHAENHYLYMGVTIGILGLAGFIAIILIFLYLNFRIFRSGADKEILMLSAAFVAAIVQYCTCVLLNPTAIVPEFTFWLILSLTVALGRIVGSPDTVMWEPGNNVRLSDVSVPPPISKTRKYLAIAVIAVSVIFGGTLISDTLLADMKLSTAINTWLRDKPSAMNAFMDAASIESREAAYYGYIGSHLFVLAVVTDAPENKQRLLDLSASTYEKAREREPYLAYWSYRTADVYSYQAEHNSLDKWDAALRLYERADRQLPGNAVILDKWALALMLKGDYQEAGQKLDEAGDADPLWSQNSYFGGLLKSLDGKGEEAGEMYVLPKKGQTRLASAIAKGPNDIESFINFCSQAAIYGVIDRVADDLKFYVDDKGDWIGWTLLAIADMNAGRNGEAIEAFSKSAELIPNEDIAILKGVIAALPWNSHALQAAADNIIAILSDRQAK